MGRPYHDLEDDAYDFYDYDTVYEEPPLYPPGKLASMTTEELRVLLDRLGDRQGALGDAEHIDDRAVEEVDRRWRLVEAELRRRK